MILILEGLDMILNLQRLTKRLDGIGWLVLGCEHAHGDGDALCLFRVNHGRMNLSGSTERGARLGGQGYDL